MLMNSVHSVRQCSKRTKFRSKQAWVLMMRRYIISGNWCCELVWCFLVQLQVSPLSSPTPQFNIKGLFCLSFYLFKKWTFVKLKLYIKSYFKIHLCICFKIIKSIMDFFIIYFVLPFFIPVRGFSSTQGIFQLFTSLKKNFKKLRLDS